MRLEPQHTSFGRHETFPLRYGWPTKGFEALTEEPDIFSQPDRAMVRLGVGRNMVSAIQYWLQAARLVAFQKGIASTTELGALILGSNGDRYLEDEATLWLLHWLIASNATLATGFFWFFNRFAQPCFQEPELRAELTRFVTGELRLDRSASTLKSDVSTLLRMYAPLRPVATDGKRRANDAEDHLDTPMSQLRLIEQTAEPRSYRSPRSTRPFLPSVALHFALAECFADAADQPALPVRDLLYGSDDRAAPGACFRLSEDGLMAGLEQIMRDWPGHYALRDTAGIHQVYRLDRALEPIAVMQRYYRRGQAAI